MSQKFLVFVFALSLLWSCSSSVKITADQKFGPDEMQEDLDVLWKTYKKNHPSYNWYTPADTIDNRFAAVKASLTDSLTESQFRLRLSYAVAAIRCGHTAVLAPKSIAKASRNLQQPSFPLGVKVWGTDSMVITQNRLPQGSPLRRGMMIQSINEKPAAAIISEMQQYISPDGYATTFAEGFVSSAFPARYKWLYGLQPAYHIQYTDSIGQSHQTSIGNWQPPSADSLKKLQAATVRTGKRPPPAPAYGKLTIDSSRKFAVMELNTFSRKHLPQFFKSSFAAVKKEQIPNLVLDLRANTGGRIAMSTLLAKYTAKEKFKVADSVSAVSLKFPYPKYVQANALYALFGWALASRQNDGRLHMRSTEKKYHKPKKKNHFDGQLYILTSGFTFSASILYIQHVINQPNVVLVGEETGGGARGNSAVMTPNLTLPNTQIRARLPLFRIVNKASLPHNGRGIMPHVAVPPSSHNYRYSLDGKMEVVKKLIGENFQKPMVDSIRH